MLPDMRHCSATFCAERTYRYTLLREWGVNSLQLVAFVGLNPSTADERVNDNTMRKLITFAHGWGFDGLYMINLFAFRATDPKVMKAHPCPVGVMNDETIQRVVEYSNVRLVVPCWGSRSPHLDRATQVEAILRRSATRLRVFGLTKDGHPRHPLYLPKTTELQEWT